MRCAVDPVSNQTPARVITNFQQALNWPLPARAGNLRGLSLGPCTFSIPPGPDVDLGPLPSAFVALRRAGLDTSFTALPEDADDIPEAPLAIWDAVQSRLVC